MKKIKVGILGATGFIGSELDRLLFSHGGVEVDYRESIEEPKPMTSVLLRHDDSFFESISKFDVEKAIKCDVVFAALPHVISTTYTRQIAGNVPVIDLSGDLRINNPATYKKYYGEDHLSAKLVEKAVYGLPELNREKIKNEKLIANPGCYATAAILASLPLAKKKAIEGTPVIDARSGISGAGQTPGPKNLFCNVNENIIPYAVGTHQHTPEIEQYLSQASGEVIEICFTPYVIPVDRGILCTTYLDLKEKDLNADKIREIYSDYYKDEPFVRVLEPGIFPNIKSVRGSNRCDIGIHFDKRTKKTIIFSAIDNLIKGAAGQAIQNMNIMFSLEETEGLPSHSLMP